MSIPARLKYILLTLIFTIATVNFVRTTLDILQSSKRLEDLRAEVSDMDAQKTQLQADLEYKKTRDYIEERARNALNMIKPGEKVYVPTAVLGVATSSPSYAAPQAEKSNLQLWYELFL